MNLTEIIKNISRRNFIRTTTLASGSMVMLNPGKAQTEDKPKKPKEDGNTISDQYDVGEIFNKGHKPYFPMLLGNGIDTILIGYSGAMGACQAHEAWNYPNMNMETVTGWFRSDIRNRPVRGVLNLLQCSYILRRGIHADGIEYSEQRFDSKKGVLLTECTLGYADLKITTFLTRDHILVHRFSVSSDSKDLSMQFFVKTASVSPLDVRIDNGGGEAKHSHAQQMDFTIQGEGWPDTPGRLYCDDHRAKMVICYNKSRGLEIPVSDGAEFAFAVQCSLMEDINKDTPPVTLQDHFNFEETLKQHVVEWEEFSGHSSIQVPHGGIEDVYNTSLYTSRAHQHPVLGGIPVGSYPGMWANRINAMDMSFCMMGLLTSNRLEEAVKGVEFWKRALPDLAQVLRDVGIQEGVGIGSSGTISMGGEAFPNSREKLLESRHHITANISLQAWQLYQYSGRLSMLKEYWDVLVQPLEFILNNCIVEFNDHAEIIRSSGPNGKERINGKSVYYPNPTFALLNTIEALRGVCKAADLIDGEIDPRWRKLLPKLERGLEANRFDGVLHHARNPDTSITNSSLFLEMFNALVDKRTLLAEMEMSRSREGLPTWTNHGYRAVPWMMCTQGGAMSRLDMEGAAKYAEMAAQFTTTLNGFAEAIRPDGIHVKAWYPTIHGAFVQQINLLLINRMDNVVYLFPGVPEEWEAVSFDSLRVPVGLIVSATRTNGHIRAEITNDSDLSQQFILRARGENGWNEVLNLNPGETISVPT